MIPAHLAHRVQQLREMRVQAPPSPWWHVITYAVGGLRDVGYAEDADLLLVISSQGRGVFDCVSGEKVARDDDDSLEYLDEVKLTATGIGPLAQQIIRVAGLHGGGLPTTTRDGWSLAALALDWPQHNLFLTPPRTSVYDADGGSVKVGADGACELRTHGFSSTGQSFVIATSCDLKIFNRAFVNA